MSKLIDGLIRIYDRMQVEHGDQLLRSINFGGEMHEPDLMLVFMNPTKANIASSPNWRGIRSPWIGTKNIWKLLYGAGLFDEKLFRAIQTMKPTDWDENFAERVYKEVQQNKVFITNLNKCTQHDARPLSDGMFKKYLNLLKKEISIVNPKAIIVFGNQVSSIIIGAKIEMSKNRQIAHNIKVGDKFYPVYPLYYTVGQGMRNLPKSIEDLTAIWEKVTQTRKADL